MGITIKTGKTAEITVSIAAASALSINLAAKLPNMITAL
jgi:hypothetical protein